MFGWARLESWIVSKYVCFNVIVRMKFFHLFLFLIFFCNTIPLLVLFNLLSLEAVCLAILIGISCDFVIHFSHAYAMHPGQQARDVRTKFALIHMGPSVLAAAATTMAGAIIMLFTEILFFGKFAVVLFMTIVHSTIGSFFVFLTITDCIGPSDPTKGVDYIVNKIRQWFAAKCSKSVSLREQDKT